jgi:MFS family permease
MLFAVVFAQTATTIVTTTPAFLIALLHSTQGLSLAQAGLLASAPTLGLLVTLIAWGAAADRWGERGVLVAGLLVCGAAMACAMAVRGYVPLGSALIVAGMGGACTNAASGRIVIASFPRERRGLAMGIRQVCQPLGTAIGALTVPPLVAAGSVTPALALGAAAVLAACVICAVIIVDPPRPERAVAGDVAAANPYRGSSTLGQIHAVSAFLVAPQFTLSIFGLVWLETALHFPAFAASGIVAAAQFLGAAGRIAGGVLSDRVGSRLRPLRWVAVASAVAMLATSVAGALGARGGGGVGALAVVAAACYVIASCISVADNGLAFIAVAEFAGPYWSGRALGAQNTGQNVAGALTGPLVGALIGAVGYPLAFALVAVAPVAAAPLVPSPALEVTR